MKNDFYKLSAIVSLVLSFLISIFLWNVDYLSLRSQYRSNMPFYEVLINSLGNIRYTLAGYLWIRTEFYIHYSGNVTINQLTEIAYYTRFITMLDPNFVEAYDFGAYQLAFFVNKPQEGLNFIKEGVKNNPNYWKLYYTAGIIYSQKEKNYVEAGKCFIKAEKLLFDPITKTKYSYVKIEKSDIGSLYRFIAKALYEQREYKSALEYYNKSLNYIPVKAELYYDILRKLERR